MLLSDGQTVLPYVTGVHPVLLSDGKTVLPNV